MIRCFAMAGLTEEDIIRVCIWICSLFFPKNQYNMQNTHIIKYKSEMYERKLTIINGYNRKICYTERNGFERSGKRGKRN